MMWNICNLITIIFEILGFCLIWIGLIGYTVHGKKPKVFDVIFDTFFGIKEEEDEHYK